MKLDTAARVAKLSSKEEVGYGARVLATGANVRRLRVAGAELEGIHYLRALGNADAIRADAEDAADVVLVGGSYIACEVAASLTALGKRCTMVMLEDAPLSTQLRPQVGRVLRGPAARARRSSSSAASRWRAFEGAGERVRARSSPSPAARSTPTWS